MTTKEQAQQLLNKSIETRVAIREMVIAILIELGATNKVDAIEFDAENGQAPAFFSINCSADADGVDVYIKKLWLGDEDEGMKADYYLPNSQIGESYECDMALAAETCVDYEDVLDWLKEKLD